MCQCVECDKAYPRPCRFHRPTLRQRYNLVKYRLAKLFTKVDDSEFFNALYLDMTKKDKKHEHRG